MKNLDQKGLVIVNILIVLLSAAVVAVGLLLFLTNTFKAATKNATAARALNAAEAGVDHALWMLNNGFSYQNGIAINVLSPYGPSGAEYKITISDPNPAIPNTKLIAVEAAVPSFSAAQSVRTVQVRASDKPATEGVAFNYAIQAGSGGIDVSGSSEIEGNLYSNGNVAVSGSAKVEDPGDVWAVGTISDQHNGIEGTKYPGSPSVALPEIDIQAWKDLAAVGGITSGNYSPPNSGSYTNFGPREILGNMSMSSSGQKINLLGPLYIHGNLTISGGEWKLDDAFGSNGTIVLVDGVIDISGSVKFFGNSSGSYVLFVSTNTANTGSNQAIKYTGSGTGEKLALYAYNGAMQLTGSGKIVAMTGQTLFISGSGKIEYESGLASASFAGGPRGAWQIIPGSWERVY